ncbi:transcription factor 21 [Caerostris darwini]|uniref:Transcription factor 21 n=1 Tax=Caerostris darwini TaxID=1538125 RepID=A0AAV4TNL9_9ARAC|nr:transcription factor 21 [Caerostris darwini]
MAKRRRHPSPPSQEDSTELDSLFFPTSDTSSPEKPVQRNAANARERARMRVLSRAFSRLKTSLPWVPPDTKLSKLDTLRLAATYIAHLRKILKEDSDGKKTVHPLTFVGEGRTGRTACSLPSTADMRRDGGDLRSRCLDSFPTGTDVAFHNQQQNRMRRRFPSFIQPRDQNKDGLARSPVHVRKLRALRIHDHQLLGAAQKRTVQPLPALESEQSTNRACCSEEGRTKLKPKIKQVNNPFLKAAGAILSLFCEF